MPRTRGESIFFTTITAWMMVYVMTVYNTVLATGSFTNTTGVYHGHGFTANFIPDYLMTYCKNFIMAFPLQLIFVGPLARLIFRTLFINHKKEKSTNEIQNDDEKIVAKTM